MPDPLSDLARRLDRAHRVAGASRTAMPVLALLVVFTGTFWFTAHPGALTVWATAAAVLAVVAATWMVVRGSYRSVMSELNFGHGLHMGCSHDDMPSPLRVCSRAWVMEVSTSTRPEVLCIEVP